MLKRGAVAMALLLAMLVVPFQTASGADSLTLLSQKTVTLPVAVPPRTATDYTFHTTALSSPTTVRVLLPRDYDPSGTTRYPVLYLLQGGAADYTSWTTGGGIVQSLTDGLDLIVVMPDAGKSAWYTDWYNNSHGGPPKWETYHIDQLIPWIDGHFQTIASRSGRAIAGLSSGGFGAMSYASRHPDLFVAAAAFSGAVDTNTPPYIASHVIDGLAAQDGGGPGSLFGLRETQEVRWRGHNPWDLAENLRGMDLTLRTGNGFPGGPGPEMLLDGGRLLEGAVHPMNVSFDQRLTALGIAHTFEDYGPGTHSFYYWNRDLEKTLPEIMSTFAQHRPDPSPFSYRSIEQRYSVYGWNVVMHRGVAEFSSLDNAGPSGFTVTGSGSATVTTPGVFTPASVHTIKLRGKSTQITAAPDGSLTISVPLGKANAVQQYFTPTGDSPATKVFTTSVTIQ